MITELLVTNIFFGITFIIVFGFGVLVFVKRPKQNSAPNITFFLFTIFACIWEISYVVGVNLYDSSASRFAFMFNIVSVFIIILLIQLVLILTDRLKARKNILYLMYGISVAITIFFIIFPDKFLLDSQPRLYLPNFFVPGDYYFIQDYFFFLLLLYLFFQIIQAYHHGDRLVRNRMKYFIVAIVYMFVTSLIPEFLLYGFNVDPMPASLVGFYVIPLAYAVLKYDLMDLNILAKRALGYALSIGGVTLFILFIGYGNDYIIKVIPSFPEWLLPLLSSVIAVAIGVFIWKKVKEVDLLKFQFIDVVTHKFRTPLTHIKWSAESLRSETDENERLHSLTDIENANTKLFEMTNSLIGLSSSEENRYRYTFAYQNIVEIINESLAAVEDPIKTKNMKIHLHIADGLPNVFIDRNRIEFVVQTIIENAIIYSQQGGNVDISVELRNAFLYIFVHDSGIGISKEDLGNLFLRFFRSRDALKVYTEGLGIGLYLSKDILKRHGGDIWAESAGIGKGSTFFIKIPLAH